MSHPKTFQELIKAHGKVAHELSGAGQSAWNGLVKETDNGVLGMADWNGTLELDQDTVTDPLRKMYATPGAQHDAATLDEFRDAFATLLHEQSHFLGPVGATQEDAKIAFQTTSAQQLEEGVTEAWTQDNLDEYLRRLGADQIAPGIENASAQKAYPEFVPAARELAAGIGARAGLSEGEVLQTLNAQTAAGQWSTATDLLYNSSNLPQLVPPDQEVKVKNAIEQVMRTEYERLDKLGNLSSHNQEMLSAVIGQDTVTAALEEIDRQEKTFAPPEASTVQTLTHQTENTLATAAETGPPLDSQNTTVENAPTADPTGPTTGSSNGQERTTVAAGAGQAAEPAVAGRSRATAAPAAEAGGPAAGAGTAAGPAVAGDARAAGGPVAGTGGPAAGVGGPAGGADGARAGAVADTSRALALAQGGQQPLGRSVRLAEGDFGGRRGGEQGAGRSQGAERPSGQRGGRGE